MSFKNKKVGEWYHLAREFYVHRKEYIVFIFSILVAALFSAFILDYFLDLTEELQNDELVNLDETVTKWAFSYRSDRMTSVVTFITDLGDATAYIILVPLIGVLLYFKGHRWRLTIQGIIVLLSASLLNLWIKDMISRPRPLEDLRLVDAHNFSFPSGHSMSAIAFYGFLVYLTFKYVDNLFLKIFLIILEIALILGIGLSRVYLGVHYPSDVLAGFAAGLFWLMVCIMLFAALNFYRRKTSGTSE
jgi:undecaprenyl-diphosphatase